MIKEQFKKFFLSILIILTFAFYAVFQRQGNSQASNQSIPNSNTANSRTTSQATSQTTGALYRDGQYTGSVADAYYGNVQVKAIVQSGKIVDVQFLDYPQDRNTSIRISNEAMPVLKSEAIQAQSANVDIVSGATEISSAFINSLSSALAQAVL